MCQQELTERRVSNMKDTKKEVMYMTDKQFLKVLKQIKLYAEECNDAQKIIQYLDKLMEDEMGNKKAFIPGDLLSLGQKPSCFCGATHIADPVERTDHSPHTIMCVPE